MANINTGTWKEKELPTNPNRSGEHYDSCPSCGGEAEPYHVTGGKDGRGEEYYLHSLYVHDRRKGGCGHNWTRTDPRAATKDRSRGLYPKHLTGSGEVSRTMFTPTEAYRDNYERAFGHE